MVRRWPVPADVSTIHQVSATMHYTTAMRHSKAPASTNNVHLIDVSVAVRFRSDRFDRTDPGVFAQLAVVCGTIQSLVWFLAPTRLRTAKRQRRLDHQTTKLHPRG